MPVLRYADLVERAWRPGQTMREPVSAETGAENLSIQYFEVAPDSVVPSHLHDVEEAVVILQGRIRVRIADEEFEATPADICLFPAGVPHSFRGAGDAAARILTVFPISDAITSTHTTYLEGDPPAVWA